MVQTNRQYRMRALVMACMMGFMVGILVGIIFTTTFTSSIKYGSSQSLTAAPLKTQIFIDPPLHQIEQIKPMKMTNHHDDDNTDSPPPPPPVTHENARPHHGHARGAMPLPPDILAPTTDLFLRRLWGNPDEDLPFLPKYLVTFTVGIHQKDIVNEAVLKFSKNWTIVLFHYDGRVDAWNQFEWAQRAIHISARKQSKWWFAKRFLHPDVVAPFEYVFIWDEDLGVEHFNGEKYIHLVKKHGLEISQPALNSSGKDLAWELTKRLPNSEVHKSTKEQPGKCKDSLQPPCAGFVEIMAPVFSRSAWGCVWHLLQNDLIHGWGLDFEMGRCIEPAYEKIGVVDEEYILHKSVPSLGNQGVMLNGTTPWQGVRNRCFHEWKVFEERLRNADKAMHQTHNASRDSYPY